MIIKDYKVSWVHRETMDGPDVINLENPELVSVIITGRIREENIA